MTYICVGNLTNTGSDNGLSPGRHQTIIWTILGILLIGSLGTALNEILSEIHTSSIKEMHLKMSSAKCRPFCLGLNVLIYWDWDKMDDPMAWRQPGDKPLSEPMSGVKVEHESYLSPSTRPLVWPEECLLKVSWTKWNNRHSLALIIHGVRDKMAANLLLLNMRIWITLSQIFFQWSS